VSDLISAQTPALAQASAAFQSTAGNLRDYQVAMDPYVQMALSSWRGAAPQEFVELHRQWLDQGTRVQNLLDQHGLGVRGSAAEYDNFNTESAASLRSAGSAAGPPFGNALGGPVAGGPDPRV
jgi:WXG100 family type VII secretion target